MNIILASSSERRKELLRRIVKDFKIIPSKFDESKVKFNGDCADYVMKLAKGKALDVAISLKDKNSIVIASDTVVYFKNQILGKPSSKKEAFNMINSLSGNIHNVYSGLAIYSLKENILKLDYSCTEVKFSNIGDEIIKEYIDTGEPMDKAGSYGIQGYGAIFVEKINGCYYNVVGLPLNKLYFLLKEMGVNL